MKTIRTFLTMAICATVLSCDDTLKTDTCPIKEGTFILNNGKWGDNNSNIGIYSPMEKDFRADVFLTANGRMLGDLGQDMIIFDDCLYIAVNGSQTIFVTDMLLKIKHQINAEKDGTRLSPRSFSATDDKVYVTYYEGFVGEISRNGDICLCRVGPNPEGIAAVGDRLYVANSGGLLESPCNNVSVVSVSDMTEQFTFEVNPNPSKVEASSDGKYVYISSFGNYEDCPAMLQVIETTTGVVSNLKYDAVSSIAKGPDDILYILCAGYDADWNPLPGTIHMHDMKRNMPLGKFITDGTTLPKAYSISVDRDGYIYIGCSDYINTGDVYVFTAEGRLHDKFDSQGLNPIKAL